MEHQTKREMNPAITSADFLAGGLAAAGLRHVCLGPGSRSTPLALAFYEQREVALHVHLDERSAGFLGLGLARATGRPVALLCTSGTAAANFLPAVIEAYMSQVPLIILTADRPPELRHSGANQTIDQVKMFGDHVLWAVDLEVPAAGVPEVARRNVTATAARAYAVAGGLRPGPVHLNVPFRKPLEPLDGASIEAERPRPAVVEISAGTPQPSIRHIETLRGWIDQYERGLIVCGPGCPDDDFPEAVADLARRAGYPLVADPLSGLRFGPDAGGAPLVTAYETFLAAGRIPPWEAPDIIIRFGQVVTGKWLNAYLAAIEPVVRLHARASGVWADDSHQTTHFWQVDEAALCRAAAPELPMRPIEDTASWAGRILDHDAGVWQRLGERLGEADFDGAAVYDLVNLLPERSNLVLGNSLPVRHVDQFARPSSKNITVYGNRGASGIDGVVSTAVGVAMAEPAVPAVLLIGDVSFFHDQNGLLAARRTPNLTIVLLHNDGGGIFRRLPIAALDPPFTELFLTPHGLDFEPIARLHGLRFSRTHDRTAFRGSLTAAFKGPGGTVVEYASDGERDERLRREIVALVMD